MRRMVDESDSIHVCLTQYYFQEDISEQVVLGVTHSNMFKAKLLSFDRSKSCIQCIRQLLH